MEKTQPKTYPFVFEYLEDTELEANEVVGCAGCDNNWRVLMLMG